MEIQQNKYSFKENNVDNEVYESMYDWLVIWLEYTHSERHKYNTHTYI